MTVCIAAIGRMPNDQFKLVGASDQAITAGDMVFEPLRRKIWALPNGSVALISGDVSTQVEVFYAASARIRERLAHGWVSVEDAAYAYADSIVTLRQQRAERQYLRSINLDLDTFIARQQHMSEAWVDKITERFWQYDLGTDTIVAGVDGGGAHIYVLNGFGEIACNDAAGFAVIGEGGRHAESQFMLARHTPWNPFPEAVLLTYIAKRRAESAPAVGKNTDMFAATTPGEWFPIAPKYLALLENLYDEVRARELAAWDGANRTHLKIFVEGLEEQARKHAAEQGVPDAPQDHVPEEPPVEEPLTEEDPPAEEDAGEPLE